MNTQEVVEAWRAIIMAENKTWVLFEHGTCVVLQEPEDDLTTQAKEILKEFGPVHAGSSAGDFSTIAVSPDYGWVVTSHHQDILTHVSPDEMQGEDPSDIAVGLFGRSKRDQDSSELKVVHVEDNV